MNSIPNNAPSVKTVSPKRCPRHEWAILFPTADAPALYAYFGRFHRGYAFPLYRRCTSCQAFGLLKLDGIGTRRLSSEEVRAYDIEEVANYHARLTAGSEASE